ncbi:hypothetical protein [Lacticaseibacillus pantheris]|uniref:hypothetical protein n=1 Tax=Lacticaseibacillus pantheris TaxID=171523 RepID=UPI0026592089|nr:hypothetical protein [Lacticaseibacillus pantheris]WKF86001.1 hypothetical protein QY874_05320 [Lacticaseibacillus pantheris]
MDIQLLFYESEGKNIPILVARVTELADFLPLRRNKEGIYKRWPQAKGNLKMLFQGIVFALD